MQIASRIELSKPKKTMWPMVTTEETFAASKALERNTDRYNYLTDYRRLSDETIKTRLIG